ncbi:hypothetical protein [Campylobacter ureolyticus]|uniref:hypothetical protein n=1 Tax=Campylobacter ureolyticus TaxID=827 RepID=UPI0022B50494|nr:hypothetical protein [Campylobacter ureolyticus]MCZ6164185.1 hypothetical protein [Campylobacter ureolyticus]MCZ6166050.1 hypothetical protein [Campylobacter ureolyticus]
MKDKKIDDVEEVKKYTMKDIYYVKDYEKLRDEEFSTPYVPTNLFDFIKLKEEIKNKLSELERILEKLENLEKEGVEKLSDNIKNYLSDEKFDLLFYIESIAQRTLVKQKNKINN